MTATAADLSNSLASAIAAASPSVVRIGGRDALGSTGIVWAPDGVIVTASHSVHRDEGIDVRLDDGSSMTGTLAGRDESSDVAVVRVDRKDLCAPRWRDTAGLRVGNLVLAAGRPGRTLRATSGIVSGIGPEWRTPGGTRIDVYVDVDASLPPGFSGGPLLDAGGACIGMNTSHLVRRTGATIPHATLERIVDAILKHGSLTRPMLGVGIYPVESGLLIISVESGSAAERAGLLVGDIIRAASHRDLREKLQDGDRTLTITRGGVEKRIDITSSRA